MNKSVLLDIFAQARLRATRRDRLISQQRAVIENLKTEGVDVAETEKILSALSDARERDFVEIDWALDELDKAQQHSLA